MFIKYRKCFKSLTVTNYNTTASSTGIKNVGIQIEGYKIQFCVRFKTSQNVTNNARVDFNLRIVFLVVM